MKKNNFDEHISKGKDVKENSEKIDNNIIDYLFGNDFENGQIGITNTLIKLGIPFSSQEETFCDTEDSLIREHIEKQTKEIDSINKDKWGNGESFYEKVYKRKKNLKNKMNFLLMLINDIKKKNQYGEWNKTNFRNSISKMSKHKYIQDSLGLNSPFKIMRKEQNIHEYNILCIVDTSGSVTHEDIVEYFLNEIYSIVKNNNCHINMFSADTNLKFESKVLLNKNNIDEHCKNGIKFIGGGGTDMLFPLVKGLIYTDIKYDLCIILSDGYYPSFSKQDLLNLAKREYSNFNIDFAKKYLNVDKTMKILKSNFIERNNDIYFKHPPIVLLNSKETCFEYDKNMKTFDNGEIQEFVLRKLNKSQNINISNKERIKKGR